MKSEDTEQIKHCTYFCSAMKFEDQYWDWTDKDKDKKQALKNKDKERYWTYKDKSKDKEQALKNKDTDKY